MFDSDFDDDNYHESISDVEVDTRLKSAHENQPFTPPSPSSPENNTPPQQWPAKQPPLPTAKQPSSNNTNTVFDNHAPANKPPTTQPASAIAAQPHNQMTTMPIINMPVFPSKSHNRAMRKTEARKTVLAAADDTSTDVPISMVFSNANVYSMRRRFARPDGTSKSISTTPTQIKAGSAQYNNASAKDKISKFTLTKTVPLPNTMITSVHVEWFIKNLSRYYNSTKSSISKNAYASLSQDELVDIRRTVAQFIASSLTDLVRWIKKNVPTLFPIGTTDPSVFKGDLKNELTRIQNKKAVSEWNSEITAYYETKIREQFGVPSSEDLENEQRILDYLSTQVSTTSASTNTSDSNLFLSATSEADLSYGCLCTVAGSAEHLVDASPVNLADIQNVLMDSLVTSRLSVLPEVLVSEAPAIISKASIPSPCCVATRDARLFAQPGTAAIHEKLEQCSMLMLLFWPERLLSAEDHLNIVLDSVNQPHLVASGHITELIKQGIGNLSPMSSEKAETDWVNSLSNDDRYFYISSTREARSSQRQWYNWVGRVLNQPFGSAMLPIEDDVWFPQSRSSSWPNPNNQVSYHNDGPDNRSQTEIYICASAASYAKPKRVPKSILAAHQNRWPLAFTADDNKHTHFAELLATVADRQGILYFMELELLETATQKFFWWREDLWKYEVTKYNYSDIGIWVANTLEMDAVLSSAAYAPDFPRWMMLVFKWIASHIVDYENERFASVKPPRPLLLLRLDKLKIGGLAEASILFYLRRFLAFAVASRANHVSLVNDFKMWQFHGFHTIVNNRAGPANPPNFQHSTTNIEYSDNDVWVFRPLPTFEELWMMMVQFSEKYLTEKLHVPSEVFGPTFDVLFSKNNAIKTSSIMHCKYKPPPLKGIVSVMHQGTPLETPKVLRNNPRSISQPKGGKRINTDILKPTTIYGKPAKTLEVMTDEEAEMYTTNSTPPQRTVIPSRDMTDYDTEEPQNDTGTEPSTNSGANPVEDACFISTNKP